MSGAILPPLFQIFTGLSFFAVLVVGVLARPVLKPLWGRIIAFSLIFVALGCLLFSQATARGTLSSGAELFAAGGASFLVAAVLVAVGLFIAARSVGGART